MRYTRQNIPTTVVVRLFSVWNEQLVNKRLIVKPQYACGKSFEKGVGNFRKTYEISFSEANSCENQTKNITIKISQIFGKFLMSSRSIFDKLSMILI